MPDARWEIEYKGHKYEFDAKRELTGRRLRQAKQFYGADYGRYNNFVILLIQGDVDAWSTVMWICLDNAGEPKPSKPDMLDLPIGEIMDSILEAQAASTEDEEDWEGSEERPTSDPTPELPDSSTRTSTPSEGDSSSL